MNVVESITVMIINPCVSAGRPYPLIFRQDYGRPIVRTIAIWICGAAAINLKIAWQAILKSMACVGVIHPTQTLPFLRLTGAAHSPITE